LKEENEEERLKPDLFGRVHDQLRNRRNRILEGKRNCIPWRLPRFEQECPGIEQGKFYMITAAAKAAKTQLTDWLFVYNSVQQILDEGLNVRLKIFYFSLEIKINTYLLGIVIFFTYLCNQQKL